MQSPRLEEAGEGPGSTLGPLPSPGGLAKDPLPGAGTSPKGPEQPHAVAPSGRAPAGGARSWDPFPKIDTKTRS